MKLEEKQKGIIVTGSVFVAAAARVVWTELTAQHQKQEKQD